MIWLLAVYLAIILGLGWFSLRPIRTPELVSPGLLGAPQKDVEFPSGQLRLRGWWVEATDADTVVILVHGYMMNRSELAPVAWQLWQRGLTCFLPDLRAHGKSPGKKCTLGVEEAKDVAAAVAYVRSQEPSARIILLGSSMGAAASAIACGETPGLVDGLILDSAYSRLSSAVIGWWRFVGGNALAVLLSPTVVVAAPLIGFWPFSVDISAFLARAGPIPVLVMHGDRDNLALPAEAARNFEACTGPKRLVWFEGQRHCEGRWEQPEKYMRAIDEYLESLP